MSVRRGFTVIELAVVVALISLLAGIAVFKLRGPYRKAKLETTIARIEQLDQLARSRSRQSQRSARLVVDVDEDQLVCFDDRATELSSVSLRGCGELDSLLAGGRKSSAGSTTINIGPRGQSTSYAIRLRGSNESTRWLLFAGLTGQMTELENDREIERLLPTTGDNAD